MYDCISEHYGYGMTEEQSGDYAEGLAASMLASTVGIEFDPDGAWDERKRVAEKADANALSTLADLRASVMSALVPEVVTMPISDGAMR
jgi:pyruvoyl-dependent arginine decarboxylase (PvlArgDC)